MNPRITSTLLNDDMRCDMCGGALKLNYIAVKDVEIQVRVYKCIFCGAEYDFKVHKYTPITCPKHRWVFSHRVFVDNPFTHTIEMIFVCDRCAAIRKERQDTYDAGISGRVEIDDPRVTNTIAVNKSWAKHFIDDKELLKDGFKDATDEPIYKVIV